MRVAIFSPGDMGGAVGGALASHGITVTGDLSGRSEETRKRALDAGFVDAGSVAAAIEGADVVLSILPPAQAPVIAQTVLEAIAEGAALPVYADCNAISPSTSRKIARQFEASGVDYVDGGIIGGPPGRDTPRFYLSGSRRNALLPLDGKGISVRLLDDTIGRASAIKMCYASVTKGTSALHLAALLTAKSEGVFDPLIAEFGDSRPGVLRAMEGSIPGMPAVAGRWEREMEEIAATFEEAQVSPGFHQGAAWVMQFLAASIFSGETRHSRDKSRTMQQTLDELANQLSQGKI